MSLQTFLMETNFPSDLNLLNLPQYVIVVRFRKPVHQEFSQIPYVTRNQGGHMEHPTYNIVKEFVPENQQKCCRICKKTIVNQIEFVEQTNSKLDVAQKC